MKKICHRPSAPGQLMALNEFVCVCVCVFLCLFHSLALPTMHFLLLRLIGGGGGGANCARSICLEGKLMERPNIRAKGGGG